MSRVHDVSCNRELLHVKEDDTVAQAARRMVELNVGAIMVLAGGELRGVFSERDIMRRVVTAGLDPERTPVKDVMSRDVVTIDEMATLEEAMEAMQKHGCRHLPVTREARLVAFLSLRDLMNFELARKTEEIHHMRSYIHGTT